MLKYDKFMRRGKEKAQEVEIEMRITSQHSTMSPDRREIDKKKFRRKKCYSAASSRANCVLEIKENWGETLKLD